MLQSVRHFVASGRFEPHDFPKVIALAANLAFHKVTHCLSNEKLGLARQVLVCNWQTKANEVSVNFLNDRPSSLGPTPCFEKPDLHNNISTCRSACHFHHADRRPCGLSWLQAREVNVGLVKDARCCFHVVVRACNALVSTVSLCTPPCRFQSHDHNETQPLDFALFNSLNETAPLFRNKSIGCVRLGRQMTETPCNPEVRCLQETEPR